MMNFKDTIVQKKAKKAPVLIVKKIKTGKTERYVGSFFKSIVKLS